MCELARLPLLVLSLALFAVAHLAADEGIEGRWEGVESKDGESLPMALEFRRVDGALAGTFSFPENGILDAPLQKAAFEGDQLTAVFGPPESPSAITATLANDELRGEIGSRRLKLEMRLGRVTAAERPYTIEPISIESGDVRLAGRVYRPRTGGPGPGIVIVPGSGDIPHVGHPFMADYFARQGCVCLLYEKRGVGQSTGSWRDVGFWELADDANAAANTLAAIEGVDPKRVGLFGYSQAGWVIPMAASRNPQLAFLIIVSGGPVTVEREGYWDVEYLLRKNGYGAAEIEEALSYYRLNNQVTRTGEGFDEQKAKLKEIRQRPWFKLLGISLIAPPEHSSRLWYRRVMDIDHVRIAAPLRLPVLWIYGGDDADFPSRDAARIVQEIKDQHANDFTIRIFERAGHAIQVPPPAEAKLPFASLAPEYPQLIGTWLVDEGFLDGG